MSDQSKPALESDEIELLLPWYATGKLPAAEAEAVRHALASDPEIARRLVLATDERDGARAMAEALPIPSTRARDDVFARIAAIETARGRSARTAAAGESVITRILGWIDGLNPRNIAWASAVAALLIVVQAGLVAVTLTRMPGSGTFQTASDGRESAAPGTFALVAFTPGATAAQITALLTEREMVIADGPRSGGLYRLRLSAKPLSPGERDRSLADLRARPDVIALAAPAT